MEALLARPPAERLRDGVRVVIAGPPNAGKSSLLNALVEREAAITSSLPGTTRDLIEAPASIGGIPYLLIDSAGLRATSDEVEAVGVQRAQASVAAADLILWLGDPADSPGGSRTILVQPKCDLPAGTREFDVRVSALTGEGIQALIAQMRTRALALLPAEGDVAANARQREAIALATHHLRGAVADDMIIAAEALRQARVELDRVTGRAGVEDMLDHLFGRFCIGK
jgi:tRNA modification GTPase